MDRSAAENGYGSTELIADLTNGSGVTHARPISGGPELPPGLASAADRSEVEKFLRRQRKRKLELPAEILDAASESAPGKIWSFEDDSLDSFFKELFLRIHQASPYSFDLSPKDLFHGHIFAFEDNLGILFHAKEYPRDLFPEHGAAFSSKDPDYRYRNIIWLLKPNRIWVLDSGTQSPISERLIFPDWVELPPREAWQVEVIGQYRQANTVQESYFQVLGQGLGSVNFFPAEAFAKGAGEDLLFLSCCQ